MAKAERNDGEGIKNRSYKLADSTVGELVAIAAQRSKETGTTHNMSDALRIAVRSFSASPRPAVSLMLPHFGEVPCGNPIDVESPPTMMLDPFSPLVRGDGRFLLTAIGDSMTGRNFVAGDTLIVQKQDTAVNNQNVVALVSNMATLKIFQVRTNGKLKEFWLLPANEMHQPIQFRPENGDKILGVIVGLVRKL